MSIGCRPGTVTEHVRSPTRSSSFLIGLLIATAAPSTRVGAQQPAALRPGLVPLHGEVVFDSGTPLQGITVFAVDRLSGEIVAAARSDPRGRVLLPVPDGHQVVLGTTAGRFEQHTITPLAPDSFRLEMGLMPTELMSLDATTAASQGLMTVSSAMPLPGQDLLLGLLRGAIVDETGTSLSGVRLTIYPENGGTPLATTASDPAGHFTFVLPPGRYRLRPLAAGLKPLRFDTDRERPQIVMTIDPQPAEIRLVDGKHVLTFRIEDSIDPEYYPPPAAKAWLKFSYCLDVDRMLRRGSAMRTNPGPRPVRAARGLRDFGGADVDVHRREVPLSYAARQLNLEKYWWLKKLYTDPPGTCHQRRRIYRPIIPW
jgi:hypothetical protein